MPRPRAPRLAARPLLALLLAASFAGALGAAEPPQAASGAQDPRLRDALAVLDLWIAEQVEYHQIPGLSIGIVHGEKLIWSKGYGHADVAARTPMTPSTPLRVGSVSKVFTATAIMQLRDQGKLSLEDPIVRHLPDFKVQGSFPGTRPITVGQLLSHTSGLPREGAFPYWTTHVFPTAAELRAGVAGQSALFAPGEKAKYSNLGISLAGQVVEAASGESWGAYVDRHLLAPLGMLASTAAPGPKDVARLAHAYLRKQPDGSRRDAIYYDTGGVAPAAAVVSTVEDLARFAAFHLGQGGDEVLAAVTRREMQRPHWVDASWRSGRGIGFALTRRDDRTLVAHGGWIGGHRADLLLDPGRKLAVVAQTNADDASPGLFTRKALDQVGTALAAIDAAAAQAAAPPMPDPEWQRYLGTYTDPWGWEYQVLILDGGLVLYEHSYPPEDDPDSSLTQLTPTGPRTFRMSDGEAVEFELDGAGKVARLRRRHDFYLPVPPAVPPAAAKTGSQP
jgi:D-alanyl-D-alanine carboxypeptidase